MLFARRRLLPALTPLLFLLASTGFGAKPIDPSSWTVLPLSIVLPPGVQKMEAWKNAELGHVVTIQRVERFPDPKEAIGFVEGNMGALIKGGVYPLKIYREPNCPFPNVVLDGLLPGEDTPCRLQIFFGTRHVQSVVTLLPPEKFVVLHEFDLEDAGDKNVAGQIAAHAEGDHRKYIAEMQALVTKLRSVKAPGK